MSNSQIIHIKCCNYQFAALIKRYKLNECIIMPQQSTPSFHRVHAPVHATITPAQISALVDQFYERVRQNPELGPVFETNISMTWDDHLLKMKSFWRSVLLKTGEYSGKPVPVHQQITEINDEHFQEWLSLFSQTANEVFNPDAVPLVNEIAQRIATSLWLSRMSGPYASPPDWACNPHKVTTDSAQAKERK